MNKDNDQRVKTDNEVIAEFMGDRDKVLCDPKWMPGDELTYLRYHTSWDWLMPVVEKINKLHGSDQLTGLDYDVYRSMQEWIISVDITSAYGDAVSIIKKINEYNENKTGKSS